MAYPDPGNGGLPLGRLLGSPGDELDCNQCFERLDELVELELSGTDPAPLPAVRAHLEGCRDCREEYESLRALLRADDESGRR
jgi:hypothetical protein